METLHFDLSQITKPFKPLNATNAGPWHNRHSTGQGGQYEICLLDDAHDGENMGVTHRLEFTMKTHTAILIREL